MTLAYGCSDCCGEEASVSSGTRMQSVKRDQKTKNISTEIDIVFCADGEKTPTACLFIMFDKERKAREPIILHNLGACPSGFNPVVITLLSAFGELSHHLLHPHSYHQQHHYHPTISKCVRKFLKMSDCT